MAALGELSEHYFQPRACAQHYLGLTQKTWLGELQKPEFSIKKYFYALRPLFAAMWIVEKQEKPALSFAELRSLVQEERVQRALDELLIAKEKAIEAEPIRAVGILHDFIERSYQATLAKASNLDKRSFGMDEADQFFRHWISK